MTSPSGHPARLYNIQRVAFFGTLGLVLLSRFKDNGDFSALVLAAGMLAMVLIRCPGCNGRIMVYRGTLFPQRTCPHCKWPDEAADKTNTADKSVPPP